MENTEHLHIRRQKSGKSLYHFRSIFLLWAIFVSVLISYVTPPRQVEGYTPVFGKTAVKGAMTMMRERPEQEHIVFLREEITEQKVLPTRTPTPTATPAPSKPSTEKKYEKSRQIGEYTWTIDVSDDDRAATADEIYNALNAYRQKNGKGALQRSESLSSFARSRADTFAGMGKTDSHAGFTDYINNQDGFTKLGFMRLGENSSYGYKVSGTKLIEEVYAGDSPHDSNQLGDWSHVGIGVSGLGTNIIFAEKPL